MLEWVLPGLMGAYGVILLTATILMAGCGGDVDSEGLETNNIHAVVVIEAMENQTDINAELRTEGAIVALSSSDKFAASAFGESKVLSRFKLGDLFTETRYKAWTVFGHPHQYLVCNRTTSPTINEINRACPRTSDIPSISNHVWWYFLDCIVTAEHPTNDGLFTPWRNSLLELVTVFLTLTDIRRELVNKYPLSPEWHLLKL